MNARPSHDNQAERINGRNEVEKGDVNGLEERRDTKWRSDEAKEIEVPNTIEYHQDIGIAVRN